jgi:hypothetical protein
MDPLSIQNEMRQLDRKNREFYDQLTQEQQRKFSPYLMVRWGSSVEGSADLQEYYILSTNKRLNYRFFGINTARHKKLQWLMATTVSPDVGTHRHTWISPRKRDSNKMRKQLAELFPHLDDPELDVLAEITTKQEIDSYIRDLGQQ